VSEGTWNRNSSAKTVSVPLSKTGASTSITGLTMTAWPSASNKNKSLKEIKTRVGSDEQQVYDTEQNSPPFSIPSSPWKSNTSQYLSIPANGSGSLTLIFLFDKDAATGTYTFTVTFSDGSTKTFTRTF
jgi:hypothetical protein